MESNKETKASELIKRFKSLVKQAEIIAFPKTKNSMFLPVNMETWHPVRSFMRKASTPYLYTNEKGSLGLIYFFLGVFLLIMVVYLLMLAQQIANNYPSELNRLVLTALIAFSFLSLYGLLGFLRDSRYPVILRTILLIVLGTVSLGIGVNFFPLTAPHFRTITSFSGLFKVLLLVFLALSPVFLFFIDTLLTAILIYISLLNYTETIQTPIAEQSIENLLHSAIGGNAPNEQPWHILDLDKSEITYLRLWSESSLNSSEKRTIPAIVVIPLVSILWSVEGIRNLALTPFMLSTNGAAKSWPGFIALLLILSFITIFSKSMIAIFKNIAVQSLIVETCLVAEFAVEEPKELQVVKEKTEFRVGFFNTIIETIAKIISMN